jgi:hypothetical protein
MSILQSAILPSVSGSYISPYNLGGYYQHFNSIHANNLYRNTEYSYEEELAKYLGELAESIRSCGLRRK